ncbi:hypothetical protein [Nitratireductor thuwali]|uniref:Uncharacterized protein n=1 Tax=Nitratireductor thuwali TaxID=2267699 RepID=A0ABY5MNE5_9HYPH|nr:hypothetical protein NTH_04007 [Nitratireductor thuwali]
MFWSLTLREIDTILKGVVIRRKRERNQRTEMVWHTAFMTAYAPAKSREFWKLKDLTAEPKAASGRKNAWESDFAAAQAWVRSTSKR